MRLFVIFILGLAATLTAGAQNRPSGQITFTPAVYDFGTVKETDGIVTCTVRYRNVSDRPYVIDFVSTSCGCTTPSYDKAPLMPGREATLSITYDPADRPGYFKKEIYLVSNGRKSTDIVTITGTVTGRPRTVADDYPVVFTPSGLRGGSNSVYFGNIPVGYRHTKAIELYNPTAKPIRIEAKTDGVCSVTAPSSLAPGAKGQILITYDLKSRDTYGPFKARIGLKADGAEVAVIRADGVATPDFTSLSPDERRVTPRADLSETFRYFGEVSRGKPLTHRFTLTNGGTRTLDIVNVTCSSSQVSCEVSTRQIEPGKSATLTVRLSPAGAGRLSEEVTVVTNDPTEPVIRLRAVANVK